jgi:hypothetical protein
LRGIQPGQVFTYREAVQRLSGLVGQWSIRRALAATVLDGTGIFALKNPSPEPPTPATADGEKQQPQSKKRFLISAPNPTLNRRGRPTQRYFILPEVYELCQRLGIRPSGSDTLDEADVRSAPRYRQALHRAYIQRRPGQYPRSWLASRLGVSIRTEQRYNLAADIHVQARYDSVLLSWSNLNAIADFEVAGTFLQDERGKRYPARQEIAAHLLAQRHAVVYRRQRTNHYSCDESPPTFTSTPLLFNRQHPGSTNMSKKPRPLEARSYHPFSDNPSSAAHDPPVPVSPIQQMPPPAPPALPQQRAGPPVRVERRSQRYYRRPLADNRMEYLAGRVHLETSASTSAQGMSLCNARRLVDTYGVQPVQTALKRMMWLRGKGKIRSPAGFLVIASRIAWRVQNGATELGMAAPRY